MPRLLSSLLLLTLILAAAAAPSKPHRRSFKIGRQATGNTRVRNGVADMHKAYQKYGFPISNAMTQAVAQSKIGASANVVSHSTAKRDGSTDATPEQADSEFLSPVDFGGQKLMMDFDTGSSDIWVFNTQLSAQENQGHTVFDPSESKTFKTMQDGSFDIHYGDKSFATGSVGQESVTIGGANVPNQAIGLPSKVSLQLVKDTRSNGLLGLAFKKLNTVQPQQQDTFFGNVGPSLLHNLFTANLKHSTAGSYEFGNIDQTQFVGKLNFGPVNASSGHWQFTSNTFMVGNGTPTRIPTAAPAIADTGTTLLLMDPAIVQAYYDQVPGAKLGDQAVVFPCTASLPDLHIQLSPNYLGKIPGALINFQAVGDGLCMGGLQTNGDQHVQILGDVMFKSQFVVFDGSGPRLGFAQHA